MSNIPAPVDATKTPEWEALKAHHDKLVADHFNLKDAFAADDKRVEKLSFDMSDLHFDLSRTSSPTRPSSCCATSHAR